MSDPLMNPTGEWVRLRKWINARIETLRDELENPPSGAVFEQTRGRIMELRELVGAVEIAPPEVDTPGFFAVSQNPA